MPAVSIIVPTYKRAAMLREAIASVLAQTYHDWELIVIDDGSADETSTVLRQAEAHDARIHSFTGAHQGVSASRKRGIRAATGRYIAFLDDDDLWAPRKLECQVTALEAHPEWAFVYTQADYRFEDGESARSRPRLAVDFDTLLQRNTIATPSVMMRRAVLLQVGGFRETMTVSEDVDLWLRLAVHHHFGVLPEPLTMCRQSRRRSEARYIQALRNNLVTLGALTGYLSGAPQARAVRTKIAKTHYTLARIYREQHAYFQAAREFSHAVRVDPLVGLVWQPQASVAKAVLVVKPYAGVLVCVAQGLIASVRSA